MVQKKYLCMSLLYSCLVKSKNYQLSGLKFQFQPLTQPTCSHISGSGFFFKKLAFIGLALTCLYLNKFHITKFKSLMLVVWNVVATYTFIF